MRGHAGLQGATVLAMSVTFSRRNHTCRIARRRGTNRYPRYANLVKLAEHVVLLLVLADATTSFGMPTNVNVSPPPAPASVRIIVTGGTFDKQYDAIKGELTFKQSHLPAILEQARVTVPIALEINQLIDSLEMLDEHRASILAACRTAPESCIVVIHGTDTMAQTAAVVGVAALNKTIVFTGAMIPHSVQGSDALFNLGFALAAAQTLAANTYVAMNGRVFDWQDVEKNKTIGVFEAN